MEYLYTLVFCILCIYLGVKIRYIILRVKIKVYDMGTFFKCLNDKNSLAIVDIWVSEVGMDN